MTPAASTILLLTGDTLARPKSRILAWPRLVTRAGPPAETFQRLRVLGDFVGEEFEGNEAAEHGVLRLVDDAHAPTAQLLDHAIVRDGLADHNKRAPRAAMLGAA